MYRKRPPDWDVWKQKTYVQLWEAAFLSCNIEPDSLRDSRCGERDFKFISGKAVKRLRLLIDKRLDKQFFNPPSSTSGNPILLHVILSEFVAWCLHRGYDIPHELTALTNGDDTVTVGKDSNKPSANLSGDDWKAKAIEIANEEGLKRWNYGTSQITARNICNKVATELGKNNKYWGNRGPREGGTIRSVALKGWKFIPPKSGTNGTNGTNGTKE